MGREQRINEIMINDYKISKRNLMINDYKVIKTKRNRKTCTPQLARTRADYLCSKLKSPQSKSFYLKCVWNLTDSYIDYLLSIALTKHSPAKYFSAVASKEMHANR